MLHSKNQFYRSKPKSYSPCTPFFALQLATKYAAGATNALQPAVGPANGAPWPFEWVAFLAWGQGAPYLPACCPTCQCPTPQGGPAGRHSPLGPWLQAPAGGWARSPAAAHRRCNSRVGALGQNNRGESGEARWPFISLCNLTEIIHNCQRQFALATVE